MHIAYLLAPYGGPEAYVKSLLPWLEQQGHRVSVVYTVPPQRRPSPFPSHVRTAYAPGGSIHYYLHRSVGGFRAWPLRVRALETSWSAYHAVAQIDSVEPIDVVEVCEGIPITLFCRHWTTVVRAHGSDWTFRHFCRDGDCRNDDYLVKMEARQLRDAHAVSAISRHLADHLSQVCRFPREAITVIPYPMDVDWMRLAQHSQRGDDQEVALMAVGRLERRKGSDLLLRAMNGVWERYPEAKVYLVGSEAGLTRDQLLLMVPEGKRRQVIFPGFVPRECLPGYYKQMAIYVAPTQYETFGYTILEAMACCLPVVSTRVGAIPELVEEGKNGLLVSFGDVDALAVAIQTLLDRRHLARAMGLAARSKALEYALPEIGGQLADLYQRAIAARGGPRRRRKADLRCGSDLPLRL
jgi:glycosyltransferase involved in cell wall biosynthesis